MATSARRGWREANQVSKLLRDANHSLVHPDRRREGMMVQQRGNDSIAVTISYDYPNEELAEMVKDVMKTLESGGWKPQLRSLTDRYASISILLPLTKA